MKIFIREYCRDSVVKIYGIDGEEHTKDFFEKYFLGCQGVYRTTEEEHTEYLSEAEFTIVKADDFNFFAKNLGKLQNAINIVAEGLKRGENIQDYTFNGRCYIVGELKTDQLARLNSEIAEKKEEANLYTEKGGLEEAEALMREIAILEKKAAQLKDEIFVYEFMKKVTYNEDSSCIK